MNTAPASLPQSQHKTFSFARISAIASNTLLELVRLKVFYFLVLFSLLIIGSSAFMIDFKIQEQFQLLKDVSLGAMSIFTWLLAVLTTAMLLPNDVEDRTLYTILAKPVPRLEYLLGKLGGVLLQLLISTVLMSLVFVIALYIKEQTAIAEAIRGAPPGTPQDQINAAIAGVKADAFNLNLLPGIITIYCKAAIFAAFTLLISTFASSSIFTIIISVVVYIIGHLQGVAREYWIESGHGTQLTKFFLALIALIFPDLQLFNLVDDIVAGNAIALAMILKIAGLGVAYVCVYTVVAYLIFAFKEL